MILKQIADCTKQRVEQNKSIKPFDEIKKAALAMDYTNAFKFEKAIKEDEITFICEVKKASPSKGIIAKQFPYVQIAKDYEQAGANALSVLTEPYYFKGADKYLTEIAQNVNIPILRKDFTVDSYMIYEAKVIGASAILLICSILSESQIIEYLNIADQLGLSTIVEAHTEEEVQMALNANARIIGVNNRDLKTFEVDIKNSSRLRALVPENVIFVSESGIETAEDIKKLVQNKTDSVIIGETLMRSNDKGAKLKYLRGE